MTTTPPPKSAMTSPIRMPRRKRYWLYLRRFLVSSLGALSILFLSAPFLAAPTTQYPRGPHESDIFWEPFTVRIGGGNFSFAQAKFLDVAWDVVIGRLGQGALLWIAYRVHGAMLLHMLETSFVDYEVITALAITGSPLAVVWALGRRIFAAGVRHRIQFFTIALSTVYIVVFPTLMATVTGYAALPPVECNDDPDAEVEVRYAYGMITVMLMAAFGIHLIWSYVMYFWWIHATRHSQLWQAGRRVGMLRMILHIADAMAHDLGPDADETTQKEIEKRLAGIRNGVRYRQTAEDEHIRFSLRSASSYNDDDKIDIPMASGYQPVALEVDEKAQTSEREEPRGSIQTQGSRAGEPAELEISEIRTVGA